MGSNYTNKMGGSKLIYFPLRGRGEPVRLALSAAGEEWDEVIVKLGARPDLGGHVEYADFKSEAGTDKCAFGQCPIYEDDTIRITQMEAIMRHIGRKYPKMYGNGDIKLMGHIDEILAACADLRAKYGALVYQDKLDPDAVAKYMTVHFDMASIRDRTFGAHYHFMEQYLERSGTGFFVGDQLSIADIMVFDVLDLHMRPCFDGQALGVKTYPKLLAFHERIKNLPQLKKYIESDRRCEMINGVPLG